MVKESDHHLRFSYVAMLVLWVQQSRLFKIRGCLFRNSYQFLQWSVFVLQFPEVIPTYHAAHMIDHGIVVR